MKNLPPLPRRSVIVIPLPQQKKTQLWVHYFVSDNFTVDNKSSHTQKFHLLWFLLWEKLKHSNYINGKVNFWWVSHSTFLCNHFLKNLMSYQIKNENISPAVHKICIHTMHAHVCIYIYVCIYVYMYVCMYACMYVCMHACMHACMYICMYVCMYVHMYIYIDTDRQIDLNMSWNII